MRVIFLDIDGVLLSGRAWCLPQNVAARRLLRSDRLREAMARVVFDPGAVALVNRLAERCGARLVVHSYWRRTIGVEETHQKLIAQGIEACHFHDDPSCPFHPRSKKAEDIDQWLMKHRVTAAPEWPPGVSRTFWEPRSAKQQRLVRNYERRLAQHGIDYIVIDDQHLGIRDGAQVVVDDLDGFSAADYRVAGGLFGIEDTELGLHRVSDEDLQRAQRALKERVPAADWLHRSRQLGSTRAARLNVGEIRRSLWEMSLWLGRPRDEDAAIAEAREKVWRELKRSPRR